MKFLPTEVWIVSGKGESDTSKINAWDKALLDAGIANHNFIKYSSILPIHIKFRDFRKELIPGQEVNIILAIAYGTKHEIIGSGVSFGKIDKCWLVAELGGYYENNELKMKLQRILKEMANDRKAKIRKAGMKTNSLKIKKNYGCVFVGMIFNSNSYR